MDALSDPEVGSSEAMECFKAVTHKRERSEVVCCRWAFINEPKCLGNLARKGGGVEHACLSQSKGRSGVK